MVCISAGKSTRTYQDKINHTEVSVLNLILTAEELHL